MDLAKSIFDDRVCDEPAVKPSIKTLPGTHLGQADSDDAVDHLREGKQAFAARNVPPNSASIRYGWRPTALQPPDALPAALTLFRLTR